MRKLETLVLTAVLCGILVVAGAAVAASSPAVTTGPASHVGQDAAVLNGTINPGGKATTYYFQWGLTNAYGANGVAHSAGHGTRPVAVKTTATSLIPGTVYHYRLVASNASGISVGADRAFKTAGNPPPLVATGPAAQVGKNSVTLTAVINPNNQATTWFFQYGPSGSFGTQTVPQAIPAGTVPVTISATIQGLEARTIFNYRIVAQHSNTPLEPGLPGAFMTLPRHRPVPQIHARTRPRTVRRAPYTLTTTGAVTGPGWIPAQYDCVGNVKVKFERGGRVVAATLLALQPNCTFSGQSLFAHFPRRKRRPAGLSVVVQFAGNGYLTPRRAATETIRLR